MKAIVEYLLQKNSKLSQFEPLHAEMTYKEVKDDFKNYGYDIDIVTDFREFDRKDIEENTFLGYEIRGEEYPANRARFTVSPTIMFIFEFEQDKVHAVMKKEHRDTKLGKRWETIYRYGGPAEYLKPHIDEINEYLK